MSVNIFLLGGNIIKYISLVSKYGHDHAETVVAVVVAIVVVEIEQPSFGAIVVIATTDEERIVRIREVGVIV